MDFREVLNKKDAAKFLSVSESFLNKLVAEKGVPYIKLKGRILFLRKDLLEWLEGKRVVKPNEGSE